MTDNPNEPFHELMDRIKFNLYDRSPSLIHVYISMIENRGNFQQWRFLCQIERKSRLRHMRTLAAILGEQNSIAVEELHNVGIGELYFDDYHLLLATEVDLVIARLYFGSDMTLIYDVTEDKILKDNKNG